MKNLICKKSIYKEIPYTEVQLHPSNNFCAFSYPRISAFSERSLPFSRRCWRLRWGGWWPWGVVGGGDHRYRPDPSRQAAPCEWGNDSASATKSVVESRRPSCESARREKNLKNLRLVNRKEAGKIQALFSTMGRRLARFQISSLPRRKARI